MGEGGGGKGDEEERRGLELVIERWERREAGGGGWK